MHCSRQNIANSLNKNFKQIYIKTLYFTDTESLRI